MSGNATNSRVCGCSTQQYSDIIVNTPNFQTSSNSVYEALKTRVAAAATGTLGSTASGLPTFKSDYERMQYLVGSIGRRCGVGKKSFAN